MRRKDSITTSVYKKNTHTDRYLNYRYHHYPRTKTGDINCLKRRGENICMEKDSHSTEIKGCICCWFLHNTVKVIMKTKPRPVLKRDIEQKTLVLPYIKGLGEKVTMVCRKLNTAFTS